MGICIQVIRLCPITQCPLEFHGLVSLLLSITQTVPTAFSLHVHDVQTKNQRSAFGTKDWNTLLSKNASDFKIQNIHQKKRLKSAELRLRSTSCRALRANQVSRCHVRNLTWRAISIWLTVSGSCFSTGFQTDCRSRATLCQATRTHLSNFPGRWTSR